MQPILPVQDSNYYLSPKDNEESLLECKSDLFKITDLVNTAHVLKSIAEGASYLESLTLENEDLICPDGSDEERYYGTFDYLSPRESVLVGFFLEHVAFQRLVSPTEFFWIMEFSQLTPRRYAGETGRLIKVHLNQVEKHGADAISSIWYTRTNPDFSSTPRRQIKGVGGATFERKYDKTIVYTVTRPDRTKFRWTQDLSQDHFVGKNVAYAKACQFVLALRVLGYNNPYVNSVYDVVMSSEMTVALKQQKLSDILHNLFPDWGKPYGNIKSDFQLSENYVTYVDIGDSEMAHGQNRLAHWGTDRQGRQKRGANF